MQQLFNTCKSINIINYIDKNHMIISTDTERPLTNPTQLHDKVLDTGGLEGTYPNTIKL